MSERLVILDRDGCINEDSPHYIRSLEEWIPIPGSIEAIARLKHAGFRVAVATNQSGLARGYFSPHDLEAMHARLRELLAARGAELDYIAYCPHGPDEGCACRKPAPGLYHEISQHLGIPLAGAAVIGDSRRDLDAAAAVGARPILVLTGKGRETLRGGGLPEGARVYDSLAEAADALIAECNVSPLRPGTAHE